MKIGCFALINPFSTLDTQIDQIKAWGFHCADVTDNSDGACLGAEFGFTALASLDANPFDIKRLFEDRGVEISSFCAHASLLDPAAPWRYGTSQIIKAVRSAAAIGVKHVITTEGEASTPFGEGLTDDQAVFAVAEKLYEPLRVAADHGVKILFEPHGPISDSADLTEKLLHQADSPALGLNLDTGNLWLGGGDPVDYVKRFGTKIEHVHWKDMPGDMEEKRGKMFGCGMALIPLGAGVVNVKGTYQALVETGFDGFTTLEVAGEENVLASKEFLVGLGATV